MKERAKRTGTVCIIRKMGTGIRYAYWATLRKAAIYNSKTPRDDMFNSPDYTWCLDTESVGSVKEAKALAREYAKKLGVRIARYDERI
jgi:hypothetical protein